MNSNKGDYGVMAVECFAMDLDEHIEKIKSLLRKELSAESDFCHIAESWLEAGLMSHSRL